MDKITEVEMPPHSKRPRLDSGENGDYSFMSYDKSSSGGSEGMSAGPRMDTSKEKFGVTDQPKNGVDKNKMAEVVSVDMSHPSDVVHKTSQQENQFSDAVEDTDTAELENGNDSDNLSDISNLSGESELAWRPVSGAMSWVQDQIFSGKDPRVILRKLVPDPDIIPDHLDDFILWKIVASIVSEPPRRKKLKHINTIEDAVNLLQSAKRIMVLTGAGVSVSCGIPDFRSRDGIYARLAVDFPDLPDPQAMFDINYFKHDQRPFFKFAKEIYPGQFEPSHSHKFIRLLEKHGKLLRNYTQNIDTLEQVAGIKNVIQCHGSFATATCMNCRYNADAETIRKDIFDQVIPHCPRCSPSTEEAIMKPDIVFFGESLPEKFHSQMAADKDVCDLLIVVGSSLKVRPVALIPNSLPPDVPQILINREPLRHLNFDVELLGDCDVVLNELCQRLGNGWTELFPNSTLKEQVTKGDLLTPPLSDDGEKKSYFTTPNIPTSQPSCSSTNTTQSATSNCEISSSAVSNSSDSSSQPTSMNFKDILSKPSVVSQTASMISPTESSCNNISEPSEKETSKTQNVNISKNSIESLNSADSECDTFKGHNSHFGQPAGDNSVSSAVNNLESPDNDWQIDSSSRPSVEDVRNWWQSKHSTISSRLSSEQFLFIPPNRYVFSGAEVYSDDSDSEDGHFQDVDEEDDVIDKLESETENKAADDLLKGLHQCENKASDGLNGLHHSESESKATDDLLNGLQHSESESKATDDLLNGLHHSESESKATDDLFNGLHQNERVNRQKHENNLRNFSKDSENLNKTCADQSLGMGDHVVNKGDCNPNSVKILDGSGHALNNFVSSLENTYR